MSLEDWLVNRWLIEHRTSPQEVSDLLTAIQRDLKDCRTDGLSSDWAFSIAYNAALQVAQLALAASGYRAGREAHHERMIESLRFTLKTETGAVGLLQDFRKKRNIASSDRSGVVSDLECTEMVQLAGELYQQIQEWLIKVHPEFLD